MDATIHLYRQSTTFDRRKAIVVHEMVPSKRRTLSRRRLKHICTENSFMFRLYTFFF